MSTASLAISAAAAAFTAVAAAAAWRTAIISKRDADERVKPFISVGLPRPDEARRALIVPVKNLGLGPARQIGMQIKLGDQVISARIDHGLAPMESAEWVMLCPPDLYPADEPIPPGYAVWVEGGYQDAAGRKYRLAFLGGDVAEIEPPHA